ncbi:cytoskeleton protein RodZ [Vibrio sp. TRT 17S01]|uniref:cytoskeleton protein RodZ n=1 Tax=Vibrio sp. TRT 17S01 TaxID=3418505 RepID=UPI003CF31134
MSAEIETSIDEKKLEAGTILKRKREELGLSQQQIADRLRLRLNIIQNIETNQFEKDQVATFTRGYLRSYAKAVGLEESVVLCALDDCGEAQPQEQKMQSFSGKAKREKHDSRIMTLTWGIFIIILGISSLWWWQNQQTSIIEISDEPVIAEAEATTLPEEPQSTDFLTLDDDQALIEAEQSINSLPVPLPENSEQNDDVTVEGVIEVQEPAATDSVETTVTEAAVEEPEQQQTTSQPAEVVANSLQMSFKADCWIQVKDASGKTLATGIKKPGQILQLSGKTPYKVILGAPENVSMTFASEPVDLSGYTSGKVARFTLPR